MKIDSDKKCIVTSSVEESFEAASLLANFVREYDSFVLSGELGAGKTHFAKGFAAALGISEPVSSPTFSLANVYTSGRLELIHFDLYRLNEASELDDIDFYSLTESGAVCLIEWGEKFIDEMPNDYTHIIIKKGEGETERIICFENHGTRSQELIEELFSGN